MDKPEGALHLSRERAGPVFPPPPHSPCPDARAGPVFPWEEETQAQRARARRDKHCMSFI